MASSVLSSHYLCILVLLLHGKKLWRAHNLCGVHQNCMSHEFSPSCSVVKMTLWSWGLRTIELSTYQQTRVARRVRASNVNIWHKIRHSIIFLKGSKKILSCLHMRKETYSRVINAWAATTEVYYWHVLVWYVRVAWLTDSAQNFVLTFDECAVHLHIPME